MPSSRTTNSARGRTARRPPCARAASPRPSGRRPASGALVMRSLPAWPVAANITDSSSARSRGMSATSRPSCMTSTRSAMPSTSGSSLETMRTATPSAASCDSSRCTSALVPTSMPRVGSSTISTRGLVDSHLASTTFCWLPPDSVDTGSVSRPALTCSRSRPVARPRARSAAPSSRPNRLSDQRRVSVALRSTDSSMTRPCWRRSSGTSARPAAIAAAGRPAGQPPAGDAHLARVVAVDAEHGPDHLAAAGADQAGQGDDLAAADGEADVGEDARPGQAADLERARRRARRGLLRVQRGDLAADHAPHHAGRRSASAAGSVETHRPSRMHGDPLAEREHLVEAVRDEQHAPRRRPAATGRPRTAARPPRRTAPRSARP